MGRKVMTWLSAALVPLFNALTIFKPMDAPQPAQKLEQPRLERRDDTSRDQFLIPEEGPHTHPPVLPPPPEMPFVNDQAMFEAANQAVFSRERTRRSAQYESFFAPPPIPLIIPDDPS